MVDFKIVYHAAWQLFPVIKKEKKSIIFFPTPKIYGYEFLRYHCGYRKSVAEVAFMVPPYKIDDQYPKRVTLSIINNKYIRIY